MVEIDGEKALWFAMEKGLGLQRYRYIMEHVLDVDVSKNEDFKRNPYFFAYKSSCKKPCEIL